MTHETKHTPGPWLKPLEHEDEEYEDNPCVGYIGSKVILFNSENPYQDMLLIAAAPETAAERDRLKEINAELLEALEVAGNRLLWLHGKGSLGNEVHNWIEEEVAIINAARAKARGRS